MKYIKIKRSYPRTSVQYYNVYELQNIQVLVYDVCYTWIFIVWIPEIENNNNNFIASKQKDIHIL